MRLKWLLLICVFCSPLAFAQNPPVLFFSDLIFGPNTGWNGGTTQGAAVTIWGKNFGSTRGSSYVTINGAQATNYAEWDAIGPARGLERITFWIPSNASSGAGTISVTVNGTTSNVLSFTVTSATIYYVDGSNGNNSNNGLTTSTAFKDIWKFNPCGSGDPHHTPGSCNPSQDGQYIVYVRGGTYSTTDPTSDCCAYVYLYGPYGGQTKQKALIAYPGETVNTSGSSATFLNTANYSPYGPIDYMTISKINITGGAEFIFLLGNYDRVVGCTSTNQNSQAQAGIMQTQSSKYQSYLGNLWNSDGFNGDRMLHSLYIKTEMNDMAEPASHDLSTQNIEVGWNEFRNGQSATGWAGQIFLSKSSESGVASYPTDYIYVHHNLFNGGTDAYMYVADGVNLGNHLYFYNNILLPNNQTVGIYFNIGTQQFGVYNNLFYQSATAAGVEVFPDYTAKPTLNNNIFSPVTGGAAIGVDDLTYNPAATSDHDLYANTSVPASQPPYLVITNPISGDPQFVNPSANDFHLQSSSVARGAGVNLYATMSTLPWGKYDYEGKLYPSSGAWDVGPLQYAAASGGGGTPPSAPTGLTAVVR